METSQGSPRNVSRITAPKAERNLWKSKTLKDTSGEGAPSNCIYFFFFLPSHHQLIHILVRFYIQLLFLWSCQAMNLQKFSFFVLKGVTLIYTRGKIKFRCSPLPHGIIIFISFASSMPRHFSLRALQGPSAAQTSLHGELHQASPCSSASKADPTVLL